MTELSMLKMVVFLFTVMVNVEVVPRRRLLLPLLPLLL